MQSKKFPGIGTWKLVSCEHRASDGTVIRSYDTGLIIYDTKGNVSAQLGNADCPKFVENDRLLGSPQELKTAFEAYLAYFGTFDIDDSKKIVTHHIKSCLFPNYVGTDLVRHFEFNDGHMTLRTEPMHDGGKTFIGVLVWERVS